jgi:predicted nucleic acid-binding protein
LKADLALMDDRKARALAVKYGVRPLGCIGILQSAFRAGVLTDLRKAYQLLLGSGAYADRGIVEASLTTLNLPRLDD